MLVGDATTAAPSSPWFYRPVRAPARPWHGLLASGTLTCHGDGTLTRTNIAPNDLPLRPGRRSASTGSTPAARTTARSAWISARSAPPPAAAGSRAMTNLLRGPERRRSRRAERRHDRPRKASSSPAPPMAPRRRSTSCRSRPSPPRRRSLGPPAAPVPGPRRRASAICAPPAGDRTVVARRRRRRPGCGVHQNDWRSARLFSQCVRNHNDR